jgi:hypothetical protein
MRGGQSRPVAGELHVDARGPGREPLVFVLLEVHFKEAGPLAVLAEVVGFNERLARLDGMLDGVQLHHPGEPDGGLLLFVRTDLAHHLIHRSAQGGWGSSALGIGPASAGRASFALLYRLVHEQTRLMSYLDVF